MDRKILQLEKQERAGKKKSQMKVPLSWGPPSMPNSAKENVISGFGVLLEFPAIISS